MKEIIKQAIALKEETVGLRRDFHKYPERGFCEFRTAYKIIKCLNDLGFDIKYGTEVIDKAHIFGAPDPILLAAEKVRAMSEGVPEEYIEAMYGGSTAIVAAITGLNERNSKKVALRFDIDCNELSESTESDHIPYRDGYASVHEGCTHACGHDGHAAIGLTVAKLLAQNRHHFGGTVKLIFQPAEEGVRGAAAMVAAGVVDDVDYFFSGHLGICAGSRGTIACSADRFLCATKFDAEFFGKSAHAGLAPHEGNNALLAAAQAALSLHGITRHGGGASRINVGVINGGSGRNVIPEYAKIMFETRGENDDINAFMVEQANNIVEATSKIYGVNSQLHCVGHASSFNPDFEFAKEISDVVNESNLFDNVLLKADMNASEDCTAFMNRVIANGGKSTFFIIGTELASPHHTPKFDINEDSLTDAAALYTALAIRYANI